MPLPSQAAAVYTALRRSVGSIQSDPSTAMPFQPRFTAMSRLLFALLCLCGMVPLVQAQTALRSVQATLIVIPEPSSYEGSIQLFLTIDVPSNGPAPTGTVQFYMNGVVLGSPVAVTNNMALRFLDTPNYPVGTYEFSAVYSGDLNYLGASDEKEHNVVKLRSEIALSLRTTTFYYGQLILDDAVATITPIDKTPDATLNGGTISFPLGRHEHLCFDRYRLPGIMPLNCGSRN